MKSDEMNDAPKNNNYADTSFFDTVNERVIRQGKTLSLVSLGKRSFVIIFIIRELSFTPLQKTVKFAFNFRRKKPALMVLLV